MIPFHNHQSHCWNWKGNDHVAASLQQLNKNRPKHVKRNIARKEGKATARVVSSANIALQCSDLKVVLSSQVALALSFLLPSRRTHIGSMTHTCALVAFKINAGDRVFFLFKKRCAITFFKTLSALTETQIVKKGLLVSRAARDLSMLLVVELSKLTRRPRESIHTLETMVAEISAPSFRRMRSRTKRPILRRLSHGHAILSTILISTVLLLTLSTPPVMGNAESPQRKKLLSSSRTLKKTEETETPTAAPTVTPNSKNDKNNKNKNDNNNQNDDRANDNKNGNVVNMATGNDNKNDANKNGNGNQVNMMNGNDNKNNGNKNKDDKNKVEPNVMDIPATPQPSTTPVTGPPSRVPTTEGPTPPPFTQRPTEPPTTQRPTQPPATRWPTRLPTTFRPTNAPVTSGPTPHPSDAALSESASLVDHTEASTNSSAIENSTQAQDDAPGMVFMGTYPPTPLPTSNQTTVQPTTLSPSTLAPSTLAPTYLPTTAPTTTPLSDNQVLERLQGLQLLPIQTTSTTSWDTNIHHVSVSFSLYFPEGEGVTGAEENRYSSGLKSSINSALQFLLCARESGNTVDFDAMGLSGLNNVKFNQHSLCAFQENVVQGDGQVDVDLSGGRRRGRFLKKDDKPQEATTTTTTTTTDTTIKVAYENGKWGEEDIEKEWKTFQEFQDMQDRADGGGSEEVDTGIENEDATTEEEQIDYAVLYEPPQMSSRVHFHARSNMAWVTWNVTWPVVRLSMDYLKRTWLILVQNEGMTDDEIFATGVHFLEQDLVASFKQNVQLKVFDVLLEDLLGEPVKASAVGYELTTFAPGLALEDGDHTGYNMTAVTAQEPLDPHAAHALRLAGITMFCLTLKFIVLLHCLSRRRKKAREEAWKRLKEGQGLLHSREGVEEMLKNTGTGGKRVVMAHGSLGMQKLKRHDDKTGSDRDGDEMNIPMPMSLR